MKRDKVMKSIVWGGLLSLMILSCDTHNPEPVTVNLMPFLFEEEGFKKEFVHNSADQLIEIRFISTFANGSSMTSIQNFTYLSNGKLKETNSDTGFKFVYGYAGNKLTRTDEYVNGVWSRYHAFTYDDQGRLIETITYQDIPEEGGIIPTAKDTYQYDDGDNLNVTRLYYYTSYGAEAKLLTTFTASEYDNKMCTDDYFNVNVINPYAKLSVNNAGKLVTQNANGNITSTELYTYQYHPIGYATSKTTQVTWHHGGTGTYTSTYTFKEY